MLMSGKKKEERFPFGSFSHEDDKDILVTRPAGDPTGRFWLTESARLIRDVFLILVVFILIGVFAIQPVVVEGSSMLPHLHDGERLLVNKLVYYNIRGVRWGHLERGDIVVFWYPKEPDKSYVKRIIGMPGDTVEISQGKVKINGVELEENYLDELRNQSLAPLSARRIDPHHYFVMGDNRDNSSDSRIWGLVPEKYIYGKALFRYWRPENMGFVEHGEYKQGNPSDDSNMRATEIE